MLYGAHLNLRVICDKLPNGSGGPPFTFFMHNISGTKSLIRKHNIARRNGLDPYVCLSFSNIIVKRLKEQIDFTHDIIALYHPIQNEVNVLPLLHEAGNFCFPVVVEATRQLAFYAYAAESSFIKGKYGIMQPAQVKPCKPTVIIVPLVAFDRRGHRIGYGGGYYDATLTALREKAIVKAIGVAYSFQEIDAVAEEMFDAKLDVIVTEKESI